MDEQTNRQPPMNDEANLRELALALLMARYPYAAEGEPQLLLGALPPDFPGDIPFPTGSRVVGSLVADKPIVVLNTDQDDEVVIAFYEEQLAALGWLMPEPSVPERHGGFLESGPSIVGRIPRQGTALYRNDGPSLQISAYKTPNGHTRVQLILTPNGARELRHNRRDMGHPHEMYNMLPRIEPPPNTRQNQGGGSMGSDHIEVEANIESHLDLSTLAAHYTTQLERGGWQRTDGEENGPVAWSTWIFEDEDKEPWRALFVILKRPDASRKSWLRIVAEWAGDRSQGGPRTTGSGLLGWQAHHLLDP
ncbi:MAG TPA: hypothetical protein VH591_12845 [Ktedonobacterales bacterium]|jgi:hypothetical protein